MAKTVLITGASRGIGRACARAFAAAGYAVAVHYHAAEDAARALADALKASGTDAEAFQADLSGWPAAEGLVAAAEGRFGHLDAVICNAGAAHQGLFTELSAADWQRMLAVNLTGPAGVCRFALPGMIRRKSGAIVLISSVWGVRGASCEAAYAAAKAGIIGLARSLAQEAGPSGVTVNAVAPGVIQTDMLRGFSPADLAALREATPLGRLGAPEDVAGLCVFLASPAAGFITGQVIGADGGFGG
jgi:3-oxoacyl-[acyl-carrier protein] reductase